jgi:tRNA nucleotidyltransferase (CCA-adding enzyme)
LPIDLVNLRKEEYALDSRIPTVAFGTPLEDALRRDLTINALFYNINTGQVEDYTEHGIEDLKAGRIRTPLNPEQTFKDDPLRILRVFRFAARYNFSCDQ